MKQNRTPPPDIAPLRHYVARVQLLLCELLLWFSDVIGDWWLDPQWRAEMLEELRHLRRAQAMLVFMAADAQWTRPAAKPRPERPPNAPPGFARPRRSHRRRRVWRIVPAGRGLRGRIEHLRDATVHFDTLVARMLARLEARARVAPYIMTFAPVESCVALARVEECGVDSS